MIPVIIAVVYFALFSIVFGFIANKRVKTGSDYFNAAKQLTWPFVMCSLVLAPLGGGHTTSLWEQQASMGGSVLWWGILAGGVFLPMFMLWFGPWLRRMKVDTFPQALTRMFGPGIGFLNASIAPGAWLGIAISETLGTATAIYTLTGGQVPFAPHCIIIAGILIVLYVFFAGMLQMAWMNLVNAIMLIGGSFVAIFYLGGWLGGAGGMGGFDGIAQLYTAAGEGWKLSLTNFSPSVIFGVMLPVLVLHVTSVSGEQAKYQPCLAAKTDEDVRKGVFIGGMINSAAAFPWVIMGLVAMVLPAIAGVDPKLSVPQLALLAFPPVLVGILMVALLCATLSTGGGLMLACSQVVVNDILKPLLGSKMTDQRYKFLSKLFVIIMAAVAVIPSLTSPNIMGVFFWCFSFGMPVFVCYWIGMVWKINRKATWITILAAIFVNMWWTFAPPAWAVGSLALNFYPVGVVTIVLGLVLTAVLPGSETGMLKQLKAQEEAEAKAAIQA